jgi:hypothetical protein
VQTLVMEIATAIGASASTPTGLGRDVGVDADAPMQHFHV